MERVYEENLVVDSEMDFVYNLSKNKREVFYAQDTDASGVFTCAPWGYY